MSQPARYAITYTGNGVMRLPRAGIFQTGTRAVVDETLARIALAHGCFAVVPLADAVPITVAPEATPAPAPAPPTPTTVAPRRATRRTGAVRVPG